MGAVSKCKGFFPLPSKEGSQCPHQDQPSFEHAQEAPRGEVGW